MFCQVLRLLGRPRGLSVHRLTDERGAVTVLTAAAIVLVFGMGALAIDVGRAYVLKQRLQDVADAAALAGARFLPNQGEARYWAEATAADNGIDADRVIVSFPGALPGSAIQVKISSDITYLLAPVLGFHANTLTAAARAQGGGVTAISARSGTVGTGGGSAGTEGGATDKASGESSDCSGTVGELPDGDGADGSGDYDGDTDKDKGATDLPDDGSASDHHAADGHGGEGADKQDGGDRDKESQDTSHDNSQDGPSGKDQNRSDGSGSDRQDTGRDSSQDDRLSGETGDAHGPDSGDGGRDGRCGQRGNTGGDGISDGTDHEHGDQSDDHRGDGEGVNGGIVPLAIERSPLSFGDPVLLKLGAGDGTNGNYHALALGGQGADNYLRNLKFGFPGTVRVGDTLETEPGNMAGPTEEAIQWRIAQDPTADMGSVSIGSPRVVYVAVVDGFSGVDGRGTVRVVGFAALFLERYAGNGEVDARFLNWVESGAGKEYGLQNMILSQ